MTLVSGLHARCPACCSQKLGRPLLLNTSDLLRCRQCGLAFERGIPSIRELDDYYKTYSYSSLKPCSNATQDSYLRVLASFRPWKTARPILDVGCGQGDFLSMAQREGWEAFGFEVSEAAVSLCQQRGISIRQGESACDSYQEMKFGVITAFEVLEHLRFPGHLFEEVHALLDKGGLFYLTTPNFDSLLRLLEGDASHIIDYPGHLCLFNAKSLYQMAHKYGFRVARMETTGLHLIRLLNHFGFAKNQSIFLEKGGSPVANRSSPEGLPDSRLDVMRDYFSATKRGSLLKAAANQVLRTSGLGDSLKAWLVKI